MTAKEELTTRDGKPYFKVGFRDHAREVIFPIWDDSPWGADCREAWQPGTFLQSAGRLSRHELRPAARDPQDSRSDRRRRGRRFLARDVPAANAVRRRRDVRRAADDRPTSGSTTQPCASWSSTCSKRNREALLDAAGRHAQPSRLRRRLAGARAERDAHLRLFWPTSTTTTIPTCSPG